MKRFLFSGLLLAAISLVGHAAENGCSVNFIRPGSPAEKAGLKIGDVIVAIDSQSISGFSDLSSAVSKAGTQTDVEWRRSGADQKATLVLPPPDGKTPRLGVSCSDAPTQPTDETSTTTPSVWIPANAPTPCPFKVEPGQQVRIELKDGRAFSGKLTRCDDQIAMRSGIMYRVFNADRVSSVTVK